ncbi:hypothetical protein ACN20G_29685 (plasmid) [Streptomyces sp. BI20]|uniref:hypothetical protein n=1 Tax=Streptomyces sp. BI20 TaxID=3403460 RepID=UPI003C76C326
MAEPHEDETTAPTTAPALPWHQRGSMQLGLFRTKHPVDVPADVPVISRRLLVVFTIRYRGGDTTHNAMGVALPARHRLRFGYYAPRFLIDDPVIRQACNDHLHLRATPASLTWDDTRLRAAPHGTPTLDMDCRPTTDATLPLHVPLSTFVRDHHDALGYFAVPGTARCSPATMTIHTWPEDLPELTSHSTRMALYLRSFSITVPPPRPLP